jgi:hypothetical protein
MPSERPVRIVDPSSPDYISSPLPSQFQHLCIATRYERDGGNHHLCHFHYNYPHYSVDIGRSPEVIGQIQTLPLPLGEVTLKTYVRQALTLRLWDAGLEAMKKLSDEVGECYTLGALMLYVKRAVDAIPANSDHGKTFLNEVMLVTVINELEDRVFPETPPKSTSDACCLIL